MIDGNTLIGMGYKPAKWFGYVIEQANNKNLSGDSLISLIEEVKPSAPVHPFNEPVSYYRNIEADNKEELDNINQVIETMDELMKTPTLINGSIMPDACPTGEKGQIPVGGVAVAKNAIHPSMHSSDMCCSVFATNFGKIEPKKVLDAAHSITHFGPGGRKGYKDFSGILENSSLYERILDNFFTKDYIEKACAHLGTQGDGNHFLFVGVSETTGDTYMVTHHGSRGFGASVYKKGMSIAERYRKELSPRTLKRNAWIPFTETEGKLYWDAVQIIRDWTKLNHSVIHNKTLDKVKHQTKETFWNEHNSVFKDGEHFYHAKGATPLDDKFVPDSYNGLRLIPLNMSQPVLVVKGNSTDTNLGFAPHGAGRNISRKAHKEKKSGQTIESIFKEETQGLDVRFFSGNIDITELPSAYKNAENVQEQMNKFGLGEVVDRIMPYGCIMAGDWKKDVIWK
ncbi:RtcB family protein [Muricauda sp. CAU 1633]|uniref:RtcB family protein n=1 Tax=Allomuricauda sp. CAU 1633 TaxID=2816036 RepID=UPI001A8D1D85|nr:RtcB family protein [Muricauda sp. CAU 1633]MBO0323440.1 RtcB family protein [Muricauda sp. CAU 1633]